MGVLTRIIAMISERRPLFFFGLGGTAIVIVGLIQGFRVLQIYSITKALPVGTALLTILFITVGVFSIFTGIILHELARRRLNHRDDSHY